MASPRLRRPVNETRAASILFRTRIRSTSRCFRETIHSANGSGDARIACHRRRDAVTSFASPRGCRGSARLFATWFDTSIEGRRDARTARREAHRWKHGVIGFNMILDVLETARFVPYGSLELWKYFSFYHDLLKINRRR